MVFVFARFIKFATSFVTIMVYQGICFCSWAQLTLATHDPIKE